MHPVFEKKNDLSYSPLPMLHLDFKEEKNLAGILVTHPIIYGRQISSSFLLRIRLICSDKCNCTILRRSVKSLIDKQSIWTFKHHFYIFYRKTVGKADLYAIDHF